MASSASEAAAIWTAAKASCMFALSIYVTITILPWYLLPMGWVAAGFAGTGFIAAAKETTVSDPPLVALLYTGF